jgi:hypothetical protein
LYAFLYAGRARISAQFAFGGSLFCSYALAEMMMIYTDCAGCEMTANSILKTSTLQTTQMEAASHSASKASN